MDIPSPSEVSLDQVTQELIVDATELAIQVNERRPLPANVIESIQDELLGERVYNSNAIEGNSLTLRETRSILQTGEIVLQDSAESLRQNEMVQKVYLGID